MLGGRLAKETFYVSRTPAPVREQVLANLRRAIFNGHFRPGDRLAERELCALTGVSRTSVREALRQLEAEGLVFNIPHKGPVVATITPQEAEEIYQVRAVLEGMAGRLFAERATPEQIARLRAALAEIERAKETGAPKALEEAKDHFYDVFLSGCGNRVLAAVLRQLRGRTILLRATDLAQPGRALDTLTEMRRVVEAIEARDPSAAERFCTEHVHQAAKGGLDALRKHGG
jgi:DNA-binding GntR family transcriptional regulator